MQILMSYTNATKLQTKWNACIATIYQICTCFEELFDVFALDLEITGKIDRLFVYMEQFNICLFIILGRYLSKVIL